MEAVPRLRDHEYFRTATSRPVPTCDAGGIPTQTARENLLVPIVSCHDLQMIFDGKWLQSRRCQYSANSSDPPSDRRQTQMSITTTAPLIGHRPLRFLSYHVVRQCGFRHDPRTAVSRMLILVYWGRSLMKAIASKSQAACWQGDSRLLTYHDVAHFNDRMAHLRSRSLNTEFPPYVSATARVDSKAHCKLPADYSNDGND